MSDAELSDDVRNFHPVDPAAAVEPFAALAALRRECPVTRPTFGQYPPTTLFTQYADASAILRDYKTFASMGVAWSVEQAQAVAPEARVHIELNPPEHTDVRRLLLAAVAPPVIKRALPQLEAFATRIVAEFADRGRADLIVDWAARIPAISIAFVLGIPEADADMIHRWVDKRIDEGVRAAEKTGAAPRSASNLDDWARTYLGEQLRLRRDAAEPVDDGITRMATFEPPSGRAFSDEALALHIHSLLVAGNETTTSLMSNLMYRVLTTPGLFARIRADRTLIEPLIEESLRFEPPLQVLNRTVRSVACVHDQPLHPGETVSVSITSGNRDEAIWGDDADEFRPDRFARAPEHDHLAFGIGIHYCPGAYLARLTTRLSVEALLDATTDMRLEPDYQWEKVYYYILRRPQTLPVQFLAATSSSAHK